MPTTRDVLLQSVFSFIVLFILARILGKRQVAQLNFFDYIVSITVGDIAASWSLDNIKGIHAISSLAIWAGLSLIVSLIQRKSYKGRIFLDGRPSVVIQHGNVLEENLKKSNLSIEEMMMMLRQKDIFKLSDVEYAILETNGTLSVMKKTELQPVTPKDAGIKVIPEYESRLLIIDGHVMEKSLQHSGYTREWLLGEIMKQGASDFKDVFIAQVDSNGNVYVDLYKDVLKEPPIKEKPLLAASLKKIQADLEMFTLQTKNRQAKETYGKAATHLKDLIAQISPFLKE